MPKRVLVRWCLDLKCWCSHRCLNGWSGCASCFPISAPVERGGTHRRTEIFPVLHRGDYREDYGSKTNKNRQKKSILAMNAAVELESEQFKAKCLDHHPSRRVLDHRSGRSSPQGLIFCVSICESSPHFSR